MFCVILKKTYKEELKNIMKNFFKKYWWLIIFLFIIPFLVWICLCTHYKNNTFTRSEIVTWGSATLTYYATVILALVTVLQNEKLTEISIRSSEIEEIRLRNDHHPLIEIEGIYHSDEKTLYTFDKIYKTGFGMIYQADIDDKKTPVIIFKNIGNSPAYDVRTYEYVYVGGKKINDKDAMFDYKIVNHQQISEHEQLILNISFEKNAFFAVNYELCYKNKYNQYFHHKLYMAILETYDRKRCVQVGLKAQKEGFANPSIEEEYYQF